MIANSKQLLNAGFANSCPYQWAGSTDIDFAVDRNGLWVIYGDETNQCNIVLSKLHPDTLQVRVTWLSMFGFSPCTKSEISSLCEFRGVAV